MAIPKHKCSMLCRENEGIHVLPAQTSIAYDTDEQWQDWADLLGFQILSRQIESDVNSNLLRKVWIDPTLDYSPPVGDCIGYLITICKRKSCHETSID